MLRRDFLKYLTASVAGPFLLPATGALAAPPLNVVIIGGGMAGATAAKYLRLWAKQMSIGSQVNVTLIDKSDSYVSNIMSNSVLTGEATLNDLTFKYTRLTKRYGVKFIKATVSSVDPVSGIVYGQLNNSGANVQLNSTPFSKLILAAGIGFDYSTFTLNVPGNVYSNPYQAIPNAWQAGSQTMLLRNQLVAMTKGNDVVVTIPVSPYRHQPGPYQRACVIADWLKVKKPGSKIYLLDPNQTVDGRPPVEPENFDYAFNTIHKSNLVYIQNASLVDVTASMSGGAKIKTLSFVPNSGSPANAVNALSSPRQIVAEVANVIPKMQAAALVRDILGVQGLNGGWAMVDEQTYETQLPGIFVIGDAISSEYQPKAGHTANEQAKVCADAILRGYTNKAPNAAPVTSAVYFTPVTTRLNREYGALSSWLTATFRYGQDPQDNNNGKMLPVSGNIESPLLPSRRSYVAMDKWFTSLMADAYS